MNLLDLDLNIKLDKYKSIQEFFKMVDADKSGEIDFNEFYNYYKQFTSRLEFKEIFDIYSNNKSYLTVQELVNFFTQEQFETITDNEAAIIILEFKENNDRPLINTLSDKLVEAEKKNINIINDLSDN
jgi:Ca2+-binding EF-hand superfamily protein